MTEASSAGKAFRHMKPAHDGNRRIVPTVEDMIFIAINTPGYGGSKGLNICIWSDPGGGKTSIVKEATKHAGLNPYVIVLTRVAPEDITGIPRVIEVAVDENGSPLPATASEKQKSKAKKLFFTLKTPDLRFVNIARDPKALVIFDDATNTTPAVQAAALDILLEKEFSDGAGNVLSLKHVPMVMMANHGEGASLTPFLAPVANRMMHVWMDNRDVLKWWMSDRASQLTITTSKACSIAAAYPELLDKNWKLANDYIKEKRLRAFTTPTPQDFPESDLYAFATSRSYEFMVRWMAACEHFGVADERGIEGCIGKEKAADFIKWREIIRLVDGAYSDTIDWKKLNPDKQREVAVQATRRFQTDDQLKGMLSSINRLTELNEKSEDVIVDARKSLVKRAIGQEKPAMTRTQSAMVRKNWPEQCRQMAGPSRGLGEVA